MRFIIGMLFISIQLASIIYARFIPERFFCWAPYDSHTQFEVFVNINGNVLSPLEAEARYGYKTKGWEQRSIHNIFSLVKQYERTYGKNDNASVIIIYSTNGHPKKTWKLKQ